MVSTEQEHKWLRVLSGEVDVEMCLAHVEYASNTGRMPRNSGVCLAHGVCLEHADEIEIWN